MTMISSAPERDVRQLPLTILLAGGTAGAIDFAYVTTQTLLSGGSPARIWNGVAAALFGVQAVVDGGNAMAIVGAMLHFLIAIGAATVYVLVATRVPALIRLPWPAGIIFGALFMLAMNYVILPLSVMGHPLYAGAKGLFDALVSHVLVIGLPISLITAARLGTQS